MRKPVLAILSLALAACVTPPAPPEVQAAYWGPIPEAPTPQQLAMAPRLTNYVWLSRPDVNDYVMIYPRDAWAQEVEGTVTLACIVQAEGRVACAAGDDGLPKFDFESAARNLSGRFRIGNRAGEAEGIEGRRVDITIAFRLAD